MKSYVSFQLKLGGTYSKGYFTRKRLTTSGRVGTASPVDSVNIVQGHSVPGSAARCPTLVPNVLVRPNRCILKSNTTFRKCECTDDVKSSAPTWRNFQRGG